MNLKNFKLIIFDLDGTLVITDQLYFEIWHQILHNYNIELTDEMFTNIIQGNNDHYVVSTLLSNANVTVNEISRIKDQLFIENNKKKILVYLGSVDIKNFTLKKRRPSSCICAK